MLLRVVLGEKQELESRLGAHPLPDPVGLMVARIVQHQKNQLGRVDDQQVFNCGF